MADDPTAGETPDTALETDTAPDAIPDDQPSTDDQPWDHERGMTTIRKQREDIRKAREELKAATRSLKELETLRAEKKLADEAKLSEQERLTKRGDDLERALEASRKAQTDLANRYEVQRQAARLSIIDPEAAEKLIDWSQVEYDPAGTPTNLAEVLTDLIDAKPYLRAPEQTRERQTAGAVGNPATRTTAPGSRRYSAADIGNRTIWNANKDDIMQAMKEGRIDD